MVVESTRYARISLTLFLSVGFAAGAVAANIIGVQNTRTEPLPLLINVQTELTRLGFRFVLVPLPTSTANHIYARPLWITNRRDELWCELLNRQAWQRDAGLIHRLGHRGSWIGFRQKRSPSLHISVYDEGNTYVYEFHYDRFLSLGHTPISALKHIFAEVIPNRYFGKRTSQEHIGVLLQRRQLLEGERARDRAAED